MGPTPVPPRPANLPRRPALKTTANRRRWVTVVQRDEFCVQSVLRLKGMLVVRRPVLRSRHHCRRAIIQRNPTRVVHRHQIVGTMLADRDVWYQAICHKSQAAADCWYIYGSRQYAWHLVVFSAFFSIKERRSRIQPKSGADSTFVLLKNSKNATKMSTSLGCRPSA